jgi:uncharacterized membrane protein HdeD (DUF308 family)
MADDERTTLDVLRGSRILAYTVGLLSLAGGLVLLFWPDRTIVVVARLIGVFLVAIGLGEAFEASTSHRKGSYWGLLLARGVINVVMGGLLLFWPDVTVTVLVWLFGLDLMITGVIGLFASRHVPPELGRSSLLFRSIVALVFGFVVVVWPDVTLWVLALLVAIQLVLVGLLLLWSGYQLTRAERDLAPG